MALKNDLLFSYRPSRKNNGDFRAPQNGRAGGREPKNKKRIPLCLSIPHQVASALHGMCGDVESTAELLHGMHGRSGTKGKLRPADDGGSGTKGKPHPADDGGARAPGAVVGTLTLEGDTESDDDSGASGTFYSSNTSSLYVPY